MKEEKTIEQLLNEFEAAIGQEFVFTGSMRKYNNTWAGIITGVDRENGMIQGEKGEFSINCVALKQEEPPSLKEYRDRKKSPSQTTMF